MSLRFESVCCLNPKFIPNSHTCRNRRILTLGSITSFLAFASPREEQDNHHRTGPQDSLKQALDTFREQASKIRQSSHEKAILLLTYGLCLCLTYGMLITVLFANAMVFVMKFRE